MAYHRCAGYTKAGKPCQGAAATGSIYCGPHSERPTLPPRGPAPIRRSRAGSDFGISLMLEIAQLKAENRLLRQELEDAHRLTAKLAECP